MTAALHLAGPQPEALAQVEFPRHHGQRLPLDQPGPQTGQLPFPRGRKALEQRLADHEIDDRVAQKLEPFIIGAADAAVRQRQFQQRRITKVVANSAAEALQRITHVIPIESLSLKQRIVVFEAKRARDSPSPAMRVARLAAVPRTGPS